MDVEWWSWSPLVAWVSGIYYGTWTQNMFQIHFRSNRYGRAEQEGVDQWKQNQDIGAEQIRIMEIKIEKGVILSHITWLTCTHP
jgi:hypothetical protein